MPIVLCFHADVRGLLPEFRNTSSSGGPRRIPQQEK